MYVKLPAVANWTVAELPGWIAPASKLPAEVAVCCCESLLVHTTDPPTGTCTSAGPNLKLAIPTAPLPAAGGTEAVEAATGVVDATVPIEVATVVVALLELSLEQAPTIGNASARSANRYLIAPGSERSFGRIGNIGGWRSHPGDATHVGLFDDFRARELADL